MLRRTANSWALLRISRNRDGLKNRYGKVSPIWQRRRNSDARADWAWTPQPLRIWDNGDLLCQINCYCLFGVDPAAIGTAFEELFQKIHPDDQAGEGTVRESDSRQVGF